MKISEIPHEKIPGILNRFLKEKDIESIKFKAIKKLLELCSDVYYNSGEDPIITDELFDKCVKKYEKYSDDKIMGAKPKADGKKLVDTEHLFPELVGTLDKINSIKEFMEWINKKIKDLNLLFCDNIELLISNKEDGNSVVGIFNPDGTSVKWLSRGKDGLGLDLSNVFKKVKVTPLANKFKNQFGIKFEAVMSDEMLQKYSDASGKSYSNSRSAVAGILSAKDGAQYTNYIQLVPLRIETHNEETFISRTKELDYLNLLSNPNIGFKGYKRFLKMVYNVIRFYEKDKNFYINGTDSTLENYMRDLYKTEDKNRNKIGSRPTDGLVIEFTNKDYRKKLGRSDDRNKFDVALKFPYQVKESKVKDIIFDIGKTGRITPVVIFEDLRFNGALCNHVSIANYKRFNELQLCKGTEVLIEYRNDVLCYLQRKNWNIKEDNKKKEVIEFISKCPICGSNIITNENETFAFCENKDCPSKSFGKIVNWTEKLEMKGINEKTIEALMINHLVKDIADLYDLKVSQLEQLPGFRKRQSQNVVDIINKSRKIYDFQFLGSLNIPNIGLETSRIICKKIGFKTILKLMKHKKEKELMKKLKSCKNIGEITIFSLIEGIKENWKLFGRLYKRLELVYSVPSLEGEEEMNVCWSGFRSPEFRTSLENSGFRLTNSISKKTSLLVVKDLNQVTSKVSFAKENKIPIAEMGDVLDNLPNLRGFTKELKNLQYPLGALLGAILGG